MALTKKDKYDLTKEMLFVKFDGRCALCGEKLGSKWQIWNIDPTKTIVRHDGEVVFGDESYDNKLPACTGCNMTRVHHSHTKEDKIDIEKFRGVILWEYYFLTGNPYYKKAIRYGLIKETPIEIKFFFEK